MNKKREKEISEKSLRGKKSRAAGQRFEVKVRENLEKLGWVVSKWMNTVDYDREGKIGKLVPAKRKYNPFMKAMTIGTGFPDFICFRRRTTSGFFPVPANQQEIEFETRNSYGDYEVIGLEVKSNGYLDKAERDMCFWLITNKIFSRILIAKKGEKRGEIDYIDFEKKYEK